MKQRAFPNYQKRSPKFSRARRSFLQGSVTTLSSVLLANCNQPKSNNSSVSQETSNRTNSKTLYIYTWAGYIDDVMVKEFKRKTGIDVVVEIYKSNEAMLTRIQEGKGTAFSIIYPSEYMVQEMLDLEMLIPLDHSKITSLDGIFFDQWQDPAYDPGNRHSVPFSWGTTGLLYNQSKVPSPLEDWSYLWRFSQDLHNRVILLDDMRETLGAVLKSLGYSINSINPAHIEEAYRKLLELKPYLADFQSFGFEEQMLNGELWVAMSYSSEAIPVTLENEDMSYVVPKSGATLWTDSIVIPTSAPNVNAAYEWINYLLEPDVAARAVENLFFATPLRASYEQLSSTLKQNQNLFPPEDVLMNCEGLVPVDEATVLYEQYWTNITNA